jgi:hypothetical protein
MQKNKIFQTSTEAGYATTMQQLASCNTAGAQKQQQQQQRQHSASIHDQADTSQPHT